jgi:hypothetical protein
MLNMKKGLAIVLAAATALTFAPVANLGTAESAYAAETASKTIDSSSSTTWTSTARKQDPGVYKVVASDDDKALSVMLNDDNIAENTSVWNAAATSSAPTAQTGIDTTHPYYYEVTAAQTTGTTFTFTDANTGKNTTHTYSVYKIQGTDGAKENTLVFTFNITLKNSSGAYSISLRSTPAAGTDLAGNTTPAELAYKTGTASLTATASVNTAKKASAVVTDIKSYKIESSDSSVVSVPNAVVNTADGNLGAQTLQAKNIGSATVTVTAYSAANATGDALASSTINYNVVASKDNFVNVTLDGTHNYFTGSTANGSAISNTDVPSGGNSFTNVQLDTLITKTAKLNVTAAGSVQFVSSNPTVATVSSDGTITAVALGSTNIIIYAASTSVAKVDSVTIPVVVSTVATDKVTFKNGDKEIKDNDNDALQLDVSSATASNAVKSAKITATSAAGSTVQLTLADANKAEVRGNSNDIATLSADGTITAGSKAGKVYIHATTKAAGNISGADNYAEVIVNAKPAAELSVNDMNLDLTTNKSADIVATSNVTNPTYQYSIIKDGDDENDGIARLLGKTVTALKYGKATIQVTIPETTTTRKTTVKAKLNVLQNAAKKASDIKAASDSLTVKVGETASAGVTATVASGSAISYKSDNESVAKVAADGTITAVAPGVAVITATAPETDTMNAGVVTIRVNVPAVKPAKVTGVKVKNLKGGKVKVTWTADSNANVKYYVKKTVGKKSAGKSVGSNSTTLTVKKGATVKVKVKAYVYDGENKLVGAYSTTVTKKTDKK